MAKRRRQIGFRLIMMALMVVFFWRYLSVAAMAGLGLIYALTQLWEAFGLPRTPTKVGHVDLRPVLCLFTIVLSSAVFGLPSLLWATHGGLLGLTCGAYLLSGSILNTVFTTRGSRSAFIASTAPFVIYVVAGALLAAGSRFQVGSLVTVAIAGTMMVLSAVILWIDSSSTQRSEEAALVILGEREAQLESALQRAEEASCAKSAFLANMSHELRTPMNGVLGMASVLTRMELAPAQADMVGVIYESAKNLHALLSDVLDLSKIEAAQIDIAAEAVVPAELARQVAALFNAAAVEKGLSFAVTLDGDPDLTVIGDGLRMKQVLTNLCSNALKFTERGGIALAVRCVADGARCTVAFCVTDTGIGVSPDAQQRLFQRFAQADDSITRRFGGTGLGLAISKQLCDLMGGRIEVQSQEGIGSAFTASFDLALAGGRCDQIVPPSRPIDPAGDSEKPRVLLVEDHPVNRQVVLLMLNDLVDLDMVVNGAEGVEAAATTSYDLILMDMQMPVMDGISATEAIRAQERALGRPRTPIVMLTANAMTEHLQASLNAGADRHLAKPVTFETLVQVIEEVLEPAQEAALGMAGQTHGHHTVSGVR